MKILLAIPSKFEAAPVFKKIGAKPALGAVADASENLRAVVAGAGCEASQKRLAAAIEEYSPDAVALLGYCGACSPELACGDFVFETDSEELAEKIAAANFRRAKIACSEHAAGGAEKAELFARGFDAVEMESAFFEPLARERAMQFLHVRCVSDTRASQMPACLFDAAIDRQTGEIKPFRIFLSALKNPRLLPKFASYAREIAPAQKKYARGASAVLELLK